MSEGDSSYSEPESALILQRAAELQAQQGRGLSLTELEAAASEAGIDAALVRRAADEVSALATVTPTPAPTTGGMLGAPLHLVHERVVTGELSSSRWKDVHSEIRRQLGTNGQLQPVGREFCWTNPRGRKVRVSIVPRGGRSIIRVEERLGELGGGLFLGMGLPLTFAGLGFILPICIAVLDAPVLIPLVFAVWAGLAFTLARTIFRAIARQRDPQLQTLADGLADVCRETAALPPDPEE